MPESQVQCQLPADLSEEEINNQLARARKQFASFFRYLDNLRKSGETNMYGAAPYVEEHFGLDRKVARDVVLVWMRTFLLDQSPQARANALDTNTMGLENLARFGGIDEQALLMVAYTNHEQCPGAFMGANFVECRIHKFHVHKMGGNRGLIKHWNAPGSYDSKPITTVYDARLD